MVIVFKFVETNEEIQKTETLAEKTWTKHYIPIIGINQVNYMLKTFQSKEAIKQQITKEGYQYYLIELDGESIGYFSIKEEETYLFLSKFYILQEFRKRKLASQALAFIKTRTNNKSIRLTVNKNNTTSIAIYQHWGFKVIDAVVTNIGYNFVMDDYIMELSL